MHATELWRALVLMSGTACPDYYMNLPTYGLSNANSRPLLMPVCVPAQYATTQVVYLAVPLALLLTQ